MARTSIASKQWQLMVCREDSPMVAAKNCTTENWRTISCSERNYGECFPLVLSSSPHVHVQRRQIFCDNIVLFFIIHVVNILWVVVGIVAV
jgi:hypothetical protein